MKSIRAHLSNACNTMLVKTAGNPPPARRAALLKYALDAFYAAYDNAAT
jgi:hypothetical protein